MTNLLVPSCVIDTNVLHQLWARDILLWFAYHDILKPIWTDDIIREWSNLMIKKGVPRSIITKRTEGINDAFPDAKVSGYDVLLEKLHLPDKNDRHILAAAIISKAEYIITYNLKDFPSEVLSGYNVNAITPDSLISKCIEQNLDLANTAIKDLIETKSNPKLTNSELIDILQNNGLVNTAKLLDTKNK